jgi:hypothetical protein
MQSQVESLNGIVSTLHQIITGKAYAHETKRSPSNAKAAPAVSSAKTKGGPAAARALPEAKVAPGFHKISFDDDEEYEDEK